MRGEEREINKRKSERKQKKTGKERQGQRRKAGKER